jgi:anti-sigma B factor antagonist
MPLEVKVFERATNVYTIAPVGSIDTNTYMIMEKEADNCLAKKPKIVVLDMSGVDYMSSAGVRVVFKIRKTLAKDNAILTMVNLQPQIKKVFDIINALPELNVFTSINELDDYLDKMQRKQTE